MVENSGHHRVHHLLDCLWPSIEGRICREDRSAGQKEQFEIFHMHQAQGRFTGDQDKLFTLLEHHIRRPEQHVIANPVRDPSQGAHAARDNHHGIKRIGATGKRDIHAVQPVLLAPVGDSGLEAVPPKGLRGHNGSGPHELRARAIQVVQQALGIPGTARPRNGHQNSHNFAHPTAEGRAQYAEMGVRGQASLPELAKTCMIFAFRG